MTRGQAKYAWRRAVEALERRVGKEQTRALLWEFTAYPMGGPDMELPQVRKLIAAYDAGILREYAAGCYAEQERMMAAGAAA